MGLYASIMPYSYNGDYTFLVGMRLEFDPPIRLDELKMAVSSIGRKMHSQCMKESSILSIVTNMPLSSNG